MNVSRQRAHAPRAAAPRPAPRAPQGRTVDYTAFGDIALEGTPAGHGMLKRGARVFHRRFGNGVVEQCEGNDKVVARFKGFGPKKVLLEYLTLQD